MSEWRLWFYNHIKRHLWEIWFRWKYLDEWVSEGRDPRMFPRAGKISRANYDWAKRELDLLKEPPKEPTTNG